MASFPLPDLAATTGVARTIAPRLQKKDVLALEGPLGAGKTTFVRALLQALDDGIRDVPSPTFTLVQLYETPLFPVYHFDLYRLKNEDELDELGWDDARGEGVMVVEWPEHAGKRMPKDHLLLRFAITASQRSLNLEARGTWIPRLKDFL
jgi:tRNA threonylcarbamoyl adenosine modification protein YjeE